MHLTNAEIAKQGFAAIACGDYDAVADFLAADVKWHGGNPEDGCQNRKQALAWIRSRPQRAAGGMPELVDVVEAGDRVVLVMQRPAGAGDTAPLKFANLATFRDGRVVEMVHYDDAALALAALERAD